MTVRPWLAAANEFDGTPAQYGVPYQIACTWIAEAQVYKGGRPESGSGRGEEFVSTYTIFHEARSPEGLDVRVPKYLDLITLNTPNAEEQTVMLTIEWDMSSFGDVPDFKTVT